MLGHLAELRRRLIFSLVALGCGALACWFLYPFVVDALLGPYCEVIDPNAEGLDASGECRLLVLDPLEPLGIRMSVAGYGGLILASPVLLWHALRFVVPGLDAREKRFTLAFVFAGILLFAAGVALALWSIPRALGFLSNIGGDDLVSFFSPRRYLGFVVKMSVAFGVGFEMPVLLVFAQFTGLVSTARLKRSRHYAILGIVVLGAVLTPSGDPLTLLILSGPMYLLYELAILVGALRQRRRERAEGAEEAENSPLETQDGSTTAATNVTQADETENSPLALETQADENTPEGNPSEGKT